MPETAGPATIPGQTWTDEPTGRSIVVEETEPGDALVQMWIATRIDGDGPSVLLAPWQVRDLIAALTARVELLEEN